MRKKLIEVALPLEAINIASAREKAIRHGHPSTLHLWWARRPLAAARAVIFAQMVDDPSSHPDIFRTEKAQEKERQRLFEIIEDLVKWENTTNDVVLEAARAEIWQSWRSACADFVDHPHAKELFDRHRLPSFHDPFAGGGALPLEAQRLGLESHASDLNPVAVLINKAMIEIPPKFSGRPPVNPEAQRQRTQMAKTWNGAEGLSEDVRYYGRWLRDEAKRRIGHLYPKVRITTELARNRDDLKNLVGTEVTVVAWLWARTVKSPNPAFAHVDVPLASSFVLCWMAGKEAYVDPVLDGDRYAFEVKTGRPPATCESGTKAAGKGGFRCLLSDVPITFEYIRAEASAGRMSQRMLAIVAEGERGRIYLSPTESSEAVALAEQPSWMPTTETYGKCRVNIGLYGMTTWEKLFTPRQLVALSTFCELVQEARQQVLLDAKAAECVADSGTLDLGGDGAVAYADAIATYLAFLVSKLADKGSTLCTWDVGPTSSKTASGRSARVATVRVTFARQALAMTWDFAEVNFFSDSVGAIETVLKTLTSPLEYLPVHVPPGYAVQANASNANSAAVAKVISTDPPYFDNIGYADLSDFFYVWLRNALRPVFPDLFTTLAVPKEEELVATPYRHGSKEKAETFFLDGMTKAMHQIAREGHPAFPITIYYAFKQSESISEGQSSTGWETFLDAVIRAGLAVYGTWPIRTELGNRMIGMGANALASSIVLVCRPRPANAVTVTRREFVTALKGELPGALKMLQRGNIAPVDLAQAAIGPGMGVYTRYAKVLDASGEPVSVRDALTLINQVLDEALAEQEGDFDADTRWALAWFEQSGFETGEYGVAETLSKAKNTSVGGMVDAGILSSKGGKVRLLRPDELAAEWDPATDSRLTAWEVVHQLIRALEAAGEMAAAHLVAKLGNKAEAARELAYRLYTICERKKRAPQALSYNALVQSWPEIIRLAQDDARTPEQQVDLFGQER
jgi:putative DNA methylase